MFRAVHSGLALRPRPAPTFCPALWVADLKGGFWKEAFAFRAQAPVPAFWPCVPALTTRSSQPGPRAPAPRIPPCVGLALRPTHPGSHSGPVFRAVRSGLALRPRPAPTFCPALWVADLKGGFWKEAFAFRAQAPVPAFWPCVPALTTRSSQPGPRAPAPRIPPCVGLALRPTHPGSHSGPVFRAVRSGLALRSRVPGGVPRSRAPTQTCPPHILPHALGGGFWRRLLPPGPLPHFVPRSRPRAPAPAFPPRISGGGFEGGFSGNILERRIPGGCFEGGGLRSGSCVRPRWCVSELRILANRQNKVYL